MISLTEINTETDLNGLLLSPLSTTGTTIIAEFTDNKTGVPRAPQSTTKIFTIDHENSSSETILASSHSTSGTVTTITVATNGRNIPKFGTGAGSSTGKEHFVGSSIGCVDIARPLNKIGEQLTTLQNEKADLSGATFTGPVGFSGTTNRGITVSRLTTAQINALVAPPNGTRVYDTTLEVYKSYQNGSWQIDLVGNLTGDVTSVGTVTTIPPNTVTEAMLNLSDVTTANSTTGQHGLFPKLSGNPNEFMNGIGLFAIPPGGSGGSGNNATPFLRLKSPTENLGTSNVMGCDYSQSSPTFLWYAQGNGSTDINIYRFDLQSTGNYIYRGISANIATTVGNAALGITEMGGFVYIWYQDSGGGPAVLLHQFDTSLGSETNITGFSTTVGAGPLSLTSTADGVKLWATTDASTVSSYTISGTVATLVDTITLSVPVANVRNYLYKVNNGDIFIVDPTANPATVHRYDNAGTFIADLTVSISPTTSSANAAPVGFCQVNDSPAFASMTYASAAVAKKFYLEVQTLDLPFSTSPVTRLPKPKYFNVNHLPGGNAVNLFNGSAVCISNDVEGYISGTGTTTIVVEVPRQYTQTYSVLADYPTAFQIRGVVILGGFIYILMVDSPLTIGNQVFRYALDDLASGGTLMTIAGQTLGTTSVATMACNGNKFYFGYKGGNSADSNIISPYSLSGTTLTYDGADITCGAITDALTGLAVDSSVHIYGTKISTGIISRFDSSGTLLFSLQYRGPAGFQNWDDTMYVLTASTQTVNFNRLEFAS